VITVTGIFAAILCFDVGNCLLKVALLELPLQAYNPGSLMMAAPSPSFQDC